MMPPLISDLDTPCQLSHTSGACSEGVRTLYRALYSDPDAAAADGAAFLRQQIAAVQDIPADLPPTLAALPDWVHARTVAVGLEYRAYLASRKAGGARRYFAQRAHALYFIQCVAPTKLVDGSWLYGVLRHWEDPDFHPLIQTYLEELGDGVPGKNHVTLYRKLLATHGCDGWKDLPDTYFVQGAIQLALAHNADDFLPELIGFNLGYEQLPLHLLISSYELNELGIDPYYFTLHVTVDNADTGHAQKAVQALIDLMPKVGSRDDFYRRVLDGYRLNELGASTNSVIAEFDLEQELLRILMQKSVVGKAMHSDYCRVGGRSVNDWLAQPAGLPDFLRAMESAGWIQRGEEVVHSRFWRLVQGERAEMFGVFSAYELQVLRDWIESKPDGRVERARVMSHRALQRSLDNLGEPAGRAGLQQPRGMIRRRASAAIEDAPDNPLALLERQVAAAAGKQQAMSMLTELMAPHQHHSSVGLMATRMYRQLLAL